MSKPTQRRMKATDLYRFQLIKQPEISPDGRHVVFAVQRVDRKTEKKYTNLWIAPTGGGEPRQFTMGDHADTTPHWSPDGARIAFLSNRDSEDQSQIYVIPFDGGEARAITDLKGTFGEFRWSPDGKSLVCRFRKKDKQAIKREADKQKKKLGIAYRHIDRVFYSLDGEGYHPKERWHLWVIDVESGKARQLTDGPIYDEGAPSWSPDGQWLVFASNRAPSPDLDPDAVDLYIIPAAGGELRQLNAPLGPKSRPVFSPDGERVAYIGSKGRGDWWKNDALWVVPASGEGEARNLTAAYDFTVAASTLNDMGDAVLMPPVWSADGARLYFQVSRRGSIALHGVAVEGDEALETVVGEAGVVSAFAFDAARNKAAYLLGTMTDPGQIWLREMTTGETRQLTHVNEKLLAKLDLGEVEEVWFKGADGNDLQGWVLKPPGFDPARKYASILEIHGGPWAQYGNFFMHEFYYLAAHDYVVYFCNPRGGIGYGEEHAKAIWGGWGGADYADLMAWADLMAQRPTIDTTRMFVTGGSYGGYMTAWIIGHTDRFKAAVAQRSVTNLISMWGSSDRNWVFQQTFGDKAPYESIEQLWECSPMKHVGNARTPTLVIHSADDMRCPLEQGQQLFVALKTLGVDTELVIFPDEPHGLSRMGRTDRRVARLKHIRRWFARYS